MAKFITQETFDEVVKENMEDFDMDRESAARDAVGQFNAQGMHDLSTHTLYPRDLVQQRGAGYATVFGAQLVI